MRALTQPLTALFCLAFLLLPATAPAAESSGWRKSYAELLAKYAGPKGVRYAAWKGNTEDVAALGRVTEGIAQDTLPGGRDEKLAFYLNAYNAWTLKGVLDAYPLKSVRDVAPLFGFFTRNNVTVAGERTSLNRLEKKTILPTFKEPRVHFALNCASRSCPPLRAEPFTGDKLGAQLDEQATGYLNTNPLGVRVEGDKAALSQIFDWYAKDFAPAGGAVPFINKYRREKLADGAKVTFQPYDWSLNEAK